MSTPLDAGAGAPDGTGDETGFTLVEMMVATALLGLLFTAVMSIMLSTFRVGAVSATATDAIGEVQNAMDVVTRDIRSATAVTAANATSMTVTTNLGAAAGTTEVAFTLAGTTLSEADYSPTTVNGTLTYPATPTRTVVLSPHIDMQGSTLFTYENAAGTTLASPVASGSLSAVATVVVTMVDDEGRSTGPNYAPAGGPTSYSTVLTQQVGLRDVGYAAANAGD